MYKELYLLNSILIYLCLIVSSNKLQQKTVISSTSFQSEKAADYGGGSECGKRETGV